MIIQRYSDESTAKHGINPPKMIKTYKEHFAIDYVKNYEGLAYSRLLRLLPLIDFDRNDVVCDFACGNGMLLDLVYSKVASYDGVDFSEDFIDAAILNVKIKKYSHCRFICSEITKFCKTNQNKFTKAFAFDFTGYLSDSELMDVFDAILSALENNGTLYIHIGDNNYFIEKLKRIRIFKLLFPDYIPLKNHFTASDYRNALIRIGFKKINVRYLPHYNFLKYLHWLRFIPIIGKYFNARLFISCKK